MRENKTPFLAGPPVTGELFVGRIEEIEDLITFTRIGQPVALISPRRLGKTSLWKNVEGRLIREDIVPVLIDCWSIGSKEELAKTLPDTIIESFKSATGKKLLKRRFRQLVQDKISGLLRSIESIGGSIGTVGEIFIEFREGSSDINDVLREVFDFPENFAKEQGIHLAIMFDEFQSLGEINGQLLKLIRAKIQHHENVSYVIAGSQEGMMDYLTSNKTSPFYGMFERIYIGPLHDEEVSDFVKKRFKKFGYSIDPEAIDRVMGLTKSHPFYIQKLCLKCFMEARTLKRVDKGVVEKSYTYMLLDLGDKFEDTLRGIIGVQKTVLKTMAIHDLMTSKEVSNYVFQESIQSINVSMRELTRKGFLKKTERGVYNFVDHVFKDYIKKSF